MGIGLSFPVSGFGEIIFARGAQLSAPVPLCLSMSNAVWVAFSCDRVRFGLRRRPFATRLGQTGRCPSTVAAALVDRLVPAASAGVSTLHRLAFNDDSEQVRSRPRPCSASG